MEWAIGWGGGFQRVMAVCVKGGAASGVGLGL